MVHFINYFFCLSFIFIFLLEKNNSKRIKGKFPYTILLPDGNYFLLSSEGIYVYNNNFSLINNSYTFDQNSTIENSLDNLKTVVSEFSINNNYYIFCLVNGSFLYVFDNNNYTINKLDIKENNGEIYYNLIPYTLDNETIEYIICYITQEPEIDEIYYRINFYKYNFSYIDNKFENKFISYNNFSGINKNQTYDPEYFLSCKIYLNNYLICFYPEKNKTELFSTVFDIQDNFKKINSTSYSYEINDSIDLVSSYSNYYSKIFLFNNIFKEEEYVETYFFQYDFENNKIEFIKKIFNCTCLKMFYFKENGESVLTCYMEKYYCINNNCIDEYNKVDNKIKILKLKYNISNDIEINEKSISILDCIDMNSFSLIYNNYTKDYDLISDCQDSNTSEWFLANNSEIIDINEIYINPKDLSSDNTSSLYSDYFTILTDFISLKNSESDFHFSSIPYYSDISNNFSFQYFEYFNKDEIEKNLKEIINSINIEEKVEFKGEDFTLVIKPINSFYNESETHINFSKCEEILRNSSNLSLTLLQIEIQKKDEKSLTNQVEYQIYDNNKNPLDLSICKDIDIQVFHAINNNSKINLPLINNFKNMDVDIFNINDSFFNDICFSYSESDNDIVLEDRIKDIYQNYSLCDKGCTYNGIDLLNKIISCNCKVKSNISEKDNNLYLKQFNEINIDSNFGLIKCYKKVFSLKDKLNNSGFLIFSLLGTIQISLISIIIYKGIKPIKEYIFNEMKNNGYIEIKNINKNDALNINMGKKGKNISQNVNSPPKNNNLKLKENSSIRNISQPENEIINNFNNDNNNGPKFINNVKRKKNKKKKMKRKIMGNIISSKNDIILLENSKKKINSFPTQILEKENSTKDFKEKNIQNERANKYNYSLININLKNCNRYIPESSNIILNNYTFEEAIKYDKRSICSIFYIFLLSKQAIFHTFLYRSPLEPFILRLCLFIFIISSDLPLNAFFYLDDKISKKYKHVQNLFLFTFNNNITIILLSTFVGFIFMTLFANLSNLSNNIRDIFRKEEEKMKKNKKYKINENIKKEIFKEIESILKNHKIKIIILFIVEILLMLFFWYYVTAFCHVFSSTQISWLFDSLLSILSRLIIEILLSLGFAKLYLISIESNIHCIYKFVLFFYSFG